MGGNLPFRCIITKNLRQRDQRRRDAHRQPRALADIASDSADTTRNPKNSIGPEHLEAIVNSFIAGC